MSTKAYRTLKAALKNAINGQVIKVGDLYIVGEFNTLTEVALLKDSSSNGYGSASYCGFISAGKLNALGNGNHATPVTRNDDDFFGAEA